MDAMRKAEKEKKEECLTPEEARRRTFARAIKLISAKPRSIAELRERLSKVRSAKKADVEAAIERLKEYGYLDDERFALSFATSRISQKPVGRHRLQRDLKLKKIDQAVADEALNSVFEETPEDELIDRAIERRIRQRGQPTDRAQAKSLFDHLLRQGFSFDLVSEKIRSISRNDLDEAE
jgi:regulatory protein